SLISLPPQFFNVSETFAHPPSISLRGVVQSTKTGIRFGMDFVSPTLINQLKLTVTDKITGNQINQVTLPGIQETYDVPISNLTAGNTYDIAVAAFDQTGAPIGEPVTAEFQYQLPAAQMSITKVLTPTQDTPYFTVQVATLNLDSAV